jgi:integral membrane protein
MRGALTRYRVMAFIVGTALICLTIVIIFQAFGDHVKLAEEIVAPIHGYLYLIYLVAAADLARRAHWKLGRILIVVAAGFVPTLAFIVEHRVYQQMQAEFAAEAEAGAGSEAESEGEAEVSADAGKGAGAAVSSGAGSEPAGGGGTVDDGPAGRPA